MKTTTCSIAAPTTCSTVYKTWFEDSGVEYVWASSVDDAFKEGQATDSGRFMYVVYAEEIKSGVKCPISH